MTVYGADLQRKNLLFILQIVIYIGAAAVATAADGTTPNRTEEKKNCNQILHTYFVCIYCSSAMIALLERLSIFPRI